jgi:endonuclease YncB( thermonuclease family)
VIASLKARIALSMTFAIALMVPASCSFCQNAGTSRFTFPDEDSCGNPIMESQLWFAVKGTVREVIAPTTIRVLVMEPSPHVITVKLIGARAPADKRAAKDAISFLRRGVEGREVEVLLSPNDKYFERRTARRVEGWLSIVSTAMIESGRVAYEPPKPYTMSHYDACRYRIAEIRAKQLRLGIWERFVNQP